MKLLAHIALVCALVAGAVACVPTGPTPRRGDRLVDVDVATLDGKATRLSRVINGRVAVFTFGATWCAPCTKQLAVFNRIRRAHPATKVAVIDIDTGEGARLVRSHARKHGVTFTTLLDPASEAAEAYGVASIPATIVVGHDGVVLHRGGYTPLSRLEGIIKRALAAAAQPSG